MKVLKNYILNSSYQLLIVIIPIITIPYISRVLGPEGIGLNTFTSAIAQYFILAGSIGITTYGNREIAYHQQDKAKRSQIFWEISFLRFITIFLALLAYGVFLYFQKENLQIYLLQGLAILAAAFDISWYFMGVENFKRTVGRNFIVSLISVGCLFIFVRNESDLPIYVAIITGSPLIGNLSLWPYLKKEVYRPNFTSLKIKKHLYPTLMLFLPQIATQIYLVVNKNMIGMMDSIVHAGFFAQSDSIIKVTLSLVTSLGVVMLPRISNMFAEKDYEGIKRTVTRSFDIMSSLAIPIMFGIMGISLKFAPFFFGSSFDQVGTLMMIEAPIVVFIAWSNVLGIQYLLPLNKMKYFTTSVTIGAVLNVLINLLFIPLFGVIGAMFGTVIAEGAVTVYQMYILRIDFDIKSLLTRTWKYTIAGFIMFLLVFYMSQNMLMNLATLAIQIFVGMLVYSVIITLLKSEVTEMIKGIFRKRKEEKLNENQ
ncbi:oligosaccharide flippase family protein [Lactococcus garvieae subsp. garvieae]|uniref:oligosaccharide flippase family protein n=1 Tax=Lactococcus garvieae TaxID=1363 RepID=UPI0005A6A8AA|nr:polysaccharide biosynthesis C-terminal domain-containing protein [Lactococcus garvieae]KAA8719131.1 oligosaccharide flippase family protein [Lactococcus garvieae subsp. garvieae]MDG6190835.1 polysaccharide biosynthesis C-terminal domain-containing protein [Lactococcus garvieae]PCS03133.1 repeat unit transporter [Lactococcus garvieae]QPR49135.1 polysaccharide biosynthesis C-terminal domain-containing protein [Lactococcus garvieae]